MTRAVAKGRRVHYAYNSFKTPCGRLWATIDDKHIITIILDAVDDYQFADCKACLKKRAGERRGK